MPKDAQSVAKKWADKLKGSTSYIRDGVNNVSVAPSQKAVAKQEKMKANLVKSIDDGVWAAQLSKVSLQEWKDKTINKGVNRIAAGVDAAQSKFEAFADWNLKTVAAGQQKISSMPDLTLEDRLNRMVTFVRHMSENKYRKK